jgi:hypothetical protein
MDSTGFPSETQKPSAQKELGNIMVGNEPPETITEILTRHSHLTGHLFKMRLVKFNDIEQTALHVLCESMYKLTL